MITKAYVNDGSLREVLNLSEISPLGGWSIASVLQFAEDNSSDVQAIIDRISARFGVYVVIMADAPSGKLHDFAIGTGATGKATEYTTGGVTWGYSFVDEPSELSGAQLLTANTAFVTESLLALRTQKLEALAQRWQRAAADESATPFAISAIVTAGLDWYQSGGGSFDAAFTDAQGKGLIP